MPNGGFICCAQCTFADFDTEQCTLYGTSASANLLCRHFSVAGWEENSHDQWPGLRELQPGVIYEIDNSVYGSGKPSPRFKVEIITIGP